MGRRRRGLPQNTLKIKLLTKEGNVKRKEIRNTEPSTGTIRIRAFLDPTACKGKHY